MFSSIFQLKKNIFHLFTKVAPVTIIEDSTVIDTIREQLKSFRRRLYLLPVEQSTSQDQLKDILDEYRGNYFEPFAEEYVIAGFDVTFVCNINILDRFI